LEINIFGCSHKSTNLVVKKDHSEKVIDEHFTAITYHLSCSRCGKDIDIKYSKLVIDVEKYLTGK